MKLKSLVAALVATSGLFIADAAQAYDGTITFSGQVIASGCTISNGSRNVVLAQNVDTAAL